MRREPGGLIRGKGAELDKASCTRECEQAWEGPHNRTPGCLRTRFLPVGTVDLLVQIILVRTVLRAAGVDQPACLYLLNTSRSPCLQVVTTKMSPVTTNVPWGGGGGQDLPGWEELPLGNVGPCVTASSSFLRETRSCLARSFFGKCFFLCEALRDPA